MCWGEVYIPQVLSVAEAYFGVMNAAGGNEPDLRAIGSSCRSRKINAVTKTWEEPHVIVKTTNEGWRQGTIGTVCKSRGGDRTHAVTCTLLQPQIYPRTPKI